MIFNKFPSNIKVRLVLQFFIIFSTMTVQPFLIIYFSKHLGTTATGFLVMMVISVSIIGALIGGFLSDRLGRKKIIIYSEFVIFLGYCSLALFNSSWMDSIYISFCIILGIKFFESAIIPVYQALIIDSSEEKDRKEIYSCIYWMNNIAIGLGSLIGGILFWKYKFYLFLSIGIIFLISCIVIHLKINETITSYNSSSKNKITMHLLLKDSVMTFKTILYDRKFIFFTIGTFLLVSIEEQLGGYISIYLEEKFHPLTLHFFSLNFPINGFNVVGILRAENTFFAVFLSLLFSKFMGNLNINKFIKLGAICFFGGFSVLSYSTNLLLLIDFMFVATFGEVLFKLAQQVYLSSSIPSDSRSSYLAVFSFTSVAANLTVALVLLLTDYVSTMIITVGFIFVGMLSIFFNHHALNSRKMKKVTIPLQNYINN
ncbi:MFS transporter [Bacillus sp. FJAT-29814]|uniref:MFS transporter n=1 Tax=Bacillus sp. FJAT-29814 TaxID=1729688 RepID=UPI00082F2272|nr:MFS transporter [Bacillus sp. FJAT-29814]